MLSQQSQAIADGLHPITASNIVLFFHPSFSSLISISVESWGSLDIRSPGTFGAIRYYMFGHKFSMKYRSRSPHVYVNAFRELSCHKCGSTSACVGSSLCFYNSLSLGQGPSSGVCATSTSVKFFQAARSCAQRQRMYRSGAHYMRFSAESVWKSASRTIGSVSRCLPVYLPVLLGFKNASMNRYAGMSTGMRRMWPKSLHQPRIKWNRSGCVFVRS